MSEPSDEPIEYIPLPLSFAAGYLRYHIKKSRQEIERVAAIPKGLICGD